MNRLLSLFRRTEQEALPESASLLSMMFLTPYL